MSKEERIQQILKALPELLADYAEVAKDVDGNLDRYRKARIKRMNKLLGGVDRVLALAPDLDMEQVMEIAEPQTVAEPIDYEKEFGEFVNLTVPNDYVEWLKGFAQRVLAAHSSVPDTKGLETALEVIIAYNRSIIRNEINYRPEDHIKVAESALTSYRERK